MAGAKPFRAVPPRMVRGGRRSRRVRRGSFPVLLAALPIATFTAVFLWSGHDQADAIPAPALPDTEHAQFARCEGGHRVTCVVDGDTIWYRGTRIRIADINAPEVSEPQCDYEASLGARATERLTALLNAGPFSLAPIDRDHDTYGRRLLVVTRGGRSLGDTLVAEGLAERWRGYRRNWCAG